MATAAYVKGAERMLTRAEITPSGLKVRFADGKEGMAPLDELRLPARPVGVRLPNPHVVYLTLANRETIEVPWDFLRHYADTDYERREREKGARGRRALGERLRRLRTAQGLSQAELAKRAGIARISVARIEAGHQSPRYETLEKLTKGLGVPIESLLLD